MFSSVETFEYIEFKYYIFMIHNTFCLLVLKTTMSGTIRKSNLEFILRYSQAPEKAMAPHSSTLAWKTPWTEEPGRLQSMGSLRVGHDWVTSISCFMSCIGEGNGNPLQCSCLENPRDGGAWWAAVCGVAQSWTRLKRLSSSSSNVESHKWKLLSCKQWEQIISTIIYK